MIATTIFAPFSPTPDPTPIVVPEKQTTITLPFTIVIDQREKAPYQFTGLAADASQNHRPLIVPCKTSYLQTGDYSIEGMENLVTIERKSKEDLYSTLGSNLERFRREIKRMSSFAYAAVIIECGWNELVNNPPPRSRMLPKSVFRAACRWSVRYGVPWFAVDSRRIAEAWVLRSLQEFWEEQQEAEKQTKKKEKKEKEKPKMVTIPTPKENPDVARVREMVDEICSIAEEVDSDAGFEYAESVCDSARELLETVEQMNYVTKNQFTALENWLAGLSRWIRD